jgi:hypothetical protein
MPKIKKSVNFKVPFIGNTSGDKQCLQACYAMVREFFEPDLSIPWDEWGEITGYLPGKGTWSMAGLMWFKEHGYEVVHMARFDYGAFAARGSEYLVEALGEEVAQWELENSDLELERRRALQFLSAQAWLQRAPALEDIKRFLSRGYLVKCLVNMKALNGASGYLGHAVIVKGYDDDHLILHDPGLPPRPERRVAVTDFERAWVDPATQAQKLDAIRKA